MARQKRYTMGVVPAIPAAALKYLFFSGWSTCNRCQGLQPCPLGFAPHRYQ